MVPRVTPLLLATMSRVVPELCTAGHPTTVWKELRIHQHVSQPSLAHDLRRRRVSVTFCRPNMLMVVLAR
jgi:hypothetical protein